MVITHYPPSKSSTSHPSQTNQRVRDFSSGERHGSDVIDGVKVAGVYDHTSVKTTMPLLDKRDVCIWGHTHWNEPNIGRMRKSGLQFESGQGGNYGNGYTSKPPGSFQPEKVIFVSIRERGGNLCVFMILELSKWVVYCFFIH